MTQLWLRLISFRPIGSPRIWANPISPSSTALSSCRTRIGTRKPNIAKAIFQAPCFSISTRSPIIRPICRICCPRRRISQRRCAISASMRRCGSSSMTPPACKASPRVWWTLRLFGAKDVKILSGGLPKWKAEGRPLESGAVARSATIVQCTFRSRLRGFGGECLARRAIGRGADRRCARGAAVSRRNAGTTARPALRSYPRQSQCAVARRRRQMARCARRQRSPTAFTRAGVDLARPIITTCGSGVTAAILLLALETTGKQGIVLYDGSWSEWGGRQDLPIARGLSSRL